MIKRPTLVIDEKKCKANIRKMVAKATLSNATLRPHFKTHQSLKVGEWFKEAGVESATVSSVSMAHYFVRGGWKDITIAFPVNILEIDEINDLAAKASVNLLVESEYVAGVLSRQVKYPVGVFLKIDTGYHRTGIQPSETYRIDKIIEVIQHSENLLFKGFLTHAGHSYQCRGKSEIERVFHESIPPLQKLKKTYIKEYPELVISYGDTPTCSVVEEFTGIEEIRPGNFVYYDLMQHQIGSCALDEIAVAIACPVVALHPQRNEVILYGGGVHLSKDRISHDEYGTIYGIPVRDDGPGWSSPIHGGYLKSVSQEHGILRLPLSEISKLQEGDVIKILPVHSCMAADLLKKDFTVV